MENKCDFDPLILSSVTWVGQLKCPKCGIDIIYGMEHDFFENFYEKHSLNKNTVYTPIAA